MGCFTREREERSLIKKEKVHVRKHTWDGILFFVFIAVPIIGMEAIEMLAQQGTLTLLSMRLLFLTSLAFLFSALALWGYDLDVVQALFLEYKKTSYYLATKEPKRNILNDDGLSMEFKSYIYARRLNRPCRILHNVCIPMPNGNFQEIDAILITNNFIYVLECKNRAGAFKGAYDEPRWTQYIGSQQHECANLYMQNEKHKMALDRFLLEKGIIQNGNIVSLNYILTTGDMTLPLENAPALFYFGDEKALIETITKGEKGMNENVDNSAMMNRIYDALLPYALYTKNERVKMMEMREYRSKTKEFALGEFRYCQQGEESVRYNNIYAQLLLVSDNGEKCWQTRTDLGKNVPYVQNQISKGVSRERVNKFKQFTANVDGKFYLKKLMWIICIVSLVLFTLAGGWSPLSTIVI